MPSPPASKVVLIAGPTASGKSALAMAVAERAGGTVINADSMQVYAELRILTARPSVEDEARVPHRLYGHVPAREAYSVARFVSDAKAVVAETQRQGRVPIIVGGTGLYFKALIEGLAPVPPIPAPVRKRWREAAARQGASALHAELAHRDPVMSARLHPSDTQRLTRALEVIDATGISLALWQQQAGVPAIAAADTLRFVVSPERAEMHRRVDARFDAMIAAGALAEAAAIDALGLDPELPAMRAIGLSPLLDHLRGLTSLAAAVEQGKADTRQYVKRQTTWLRRNNITWSALKMELSQQIDAIMFALNDL